MHRLPGLIFMFLPLFAVADVVVPIDSVKSHVNIRSSKDAASDIVGRLRQGDNLPWVASFEGWLEVEVSAGATGFVSANWATVLDGPIVPRDAKDADATPSDLSAAPSEIPLREASIADDLVADSKAELDDAVQDVIDVVDEDRAAMVPAAEIDIATIASGADKSSPEPAAAENGDLARDLESKQEEAERAVVASPGNTPMTEESDAVTGVGLAGPAGPPGPPGPPGSASIEGSVGFLTRFTAPTVGGSSQIFDDGNNVGIGTTTPVQRLEVNGNIQIHEQNSSVAGLMITQSDGETGYIMHNRASTLTIGAGSVDRITVDRDGNVGFGVAQPSHPIDMASGAIVTAGGVWTNSSSRTRKENIAELSLADALATLSNLEPVHFNYINDQSEKYVGFIAEDVPDLVATRNREGLSPMDIAAILTKVVQEQQKQIEELEARLDQR